MGMTSCPWVFTCVSMSMTSSMNGNIVLCRVQKRSSQAQRLQVLRHLQAS